MFRSLVVITLCMLVSVTFAQMPFCKPTAGIDFSNLPVGHCKNMQQILNGFDTGNYYTFYFNWCNLGAQESCQPSYVVQGALKSCDRNFTSWTTGMTYNATQQQVSYIVNDGFGSMALITVTCDPNGASNGNVTCPNHYSVVGNNSYNYTIALTSKAACDGAPPPPPSPPASSGLGAGAVAGIVIAVVAGVGLLTYAFFRFTAGRGYEKVGTTN